MIRIRIPATSANLGPGFDVLGMALDLFNEVEITPRHAGAGKPCIEIEGEGAKTLPRNEKNIVWQAMKKVFARTGARRKGSCKFGDFHIRLVNRIPLASGLGSSAAAYLGGIMAANEITGRPLSREDMLLMGVKLEGHPDNVVPALLGGLCISMVVGNEVKYVKLPVPAIKAVVCTPDFELVTEKTRKILPRQVPFAAATFNTSRVALFLSALMTKKFGLLSAGMEDRLHQPYREHLIPGMKKIIDAAMAAGAYGVALSGAGPSIIALSAPVKAKAVGGAMQNKWKQFNIASTCFVLDADTRGASVISRR